MLSTHTATVGAPPSPPQLKSSHAATAQEWGIRCRIQLEPDTQNETGQPNEKRFVPHSRALKEAHKTHLGHILGKLGGHAPTFELSQLGNQEGKPTRVGQVSVQQERQTREAAAFSIDANSHMLT